MHDTRLLPPAPAKQLVVFLHGVGADGKDLISLGGMWRSRLPQAAFVSPDAPQAYDMAPFGRQWFSLRERTPSALLAGAQETRGLFETYLKKLATDLKVPLSKTALVGFSQGTMMALYTGLRLDETLAGILGYSGALLSDEGITAKPPVTLVHGKQDDVVPAAASQMATLQLETAGVKTALHLCDNLGHGIDDKGLAIGAAFLQKALL